MKNQREIILYLFVALATLAIGLKVFGYFLSATNFSNDAILSGIKITLALVIFSIIGNSITHRFIGSNLNGSLFLNAIIGISVAVTYVYIRNIIPLPITRYEVLAISAIFALDVIIRSQQFLNKKEDVIATIIKIIFLLFLTIIIGTRETPKVLMISTDPDQHLLYLGQLFKSGTIPWQIPDWGNKIIAYTMGSAVIGALLAWTSQLSPASTLAHMPVTLSVLAALATVEFTKGNLKAERLLLLVSGIILFIFSGLLIPQIQQFSHYEGVGRQLSMPFIIAILFFGNKLLTVNPEENIKNSSGAIFIFTLLLFTLVTLNPINMIIPFIILSGLFVFSAIKYRSTPYSYVLAIIILPLLLLDPYYFTLIISSGTGNPLGIPGSPTEISSIQQFFSAAPIAQSFIISNLLYIIPPLHSGKWFDFLILISISFVVYVFSFKNGKGLFIIKLLFIIFAIGAACYLVSMIFIAVRHDYRFSLLFPYFGFNINQYKIAALMIIFVLATNKLCDKYPKYYFGVVYAIGVVIISFIMLRDNYVYSSTVRANYCGSLGCPTVGEEMIANKINSFLSTQNENPPSYKVLVPNSIHKMGLENWLFPQNIGRLLASHQFNIPLAFYYYVGDESYTTENYSTNVCNAASTEWLIMHSIRYVILPESSDRYCINKSIIDSSVPVLFYDSGAPALIHLN
jgi:hypothetical protein